MSSRDDVWAMAHMTRTVIHPCPIGLSNMPPTLLASRARRTADANTRHAAALERATTQHHQRAITASWKHFITTTMRKDTTADYFPFVLNGLIEDRAVTASDTAAQRRRYADERVRMCDARAESDVQQEPPNETSCDGALRCHRVASDYQQRHPPPRVSESAASASGRTSGVGRCVNGGVSDQESVGV